MIFYQGPSELDGEPIVCIATDGSSNPKTGPVIQTWILRSDQSPIDARLSGDDESICGKCPMRNGGCYVSLRNAPLAIYHKYLRGGYPQPDLSFFANRFIRLGSYGDPAAVPEPVWSRILSVAKGHVGYTHQWRDRRHRNLRRWLMASVENPIDQALARARGWRTFRIRRPDDPLQAGEFVCPASPEGGHRLTCIECGACNGGRPGRASVAIVVHGSLVTKSLALRVLN